MQDDQHQPPPVARVVRGGGSARDRFVANAKPKVVAAGQVAGFALRASFTVACFVGIVVAIGSSKSKSSYSKYDFTKYRFEYRPPKFDYQPPKFDVSSLQDFDLKAEIRKDLERALDGSHTGLRSPRDVLPPMAESRSQQQPAPTATPAPKATPAPGTSRRERTLK